MRKLTSLQWLQPKNTQELNTYELWNGEQKILSVFFNEVANTVKLVGKHVRRNFTIEQEGFLKNKSIIKNEYGVSIGTLDKKILLNGQGDVELNNERFHYSIDKTSDKVALYKKADKNPFLSCSLSFLNNATNISLGVLHGLLAAICFNMLNVENEQLSLSK